MKMGTCDSLHYLGGDRSPDVDVSRAVAGLDLEVWAAWSLWYCLFRMEHIGLGNEYLMGYPEDCSSETHPPLS
jgi:hypothetical protein